MCPPVATSMNVLIGCHDSNCGVKMMRSKVGSAEVSEFGASLRFSASKHITVFAKWHSEVLSTYPSNEGI